MIEHSLSVAIAAPRDRVWTYVSEMENWASNMPGYREFEVLSERDTRWTLKVGVAALVRTVKVLVHIDRWEGPDHVAFTYNLENDPVDGAGTYSAVSREDGGTDVTLAVTINGQGPMAPAWEAMARPLLPRLAGGFVDALKAKIEEREADTAVEEAEVPDAEAHPPNGLWKRLMRRGKMVEQD